MGVGVLWGGGSILELDSERGGWPHAIVNGLHVINGKFYMMCIVPEFV